MIVLSDTRNDDISSSAGTPQQPRRWSWARPLAVSLGYLILFLTLSYASLGRETSSGISPWHPAVGMGVALLLVFGLSYVPVVLIGNIAAMLLFKPELGNPMEGWGVVLLSTLVYTLAAAVLRHGLRIDPHLGRLRDVIYLLLIAILAPILVAAVCIPFLPLAHTDFATYIEQVRNWWVADAIGLMTVTPFLLAHGAPWTTLMRRARGMFNDDSLTGEVELAPEHMPFWQAALETLAWCTAIGLVLLVTTYPPLASEYHLAYLSFLLLIWLSLRHGTLGTTAGVIAFMLGTILMIRFQYPQHEQFAELQVYLLTLSLSGLLLGAVVSERKRTERVVRENEDLLRTLINAMPDLVAFKDAHGRWVRANDFGLSLFQLNGIDYQGKTDTELGDGHPRLREVFHHFATQDEQTWQSGQPTRAEEAIPGAGGAAMIFDVIKVPLYHPDGTRKGLVMIGRDITERKRAEEELETERAFLSSAIDILPLPMAFFTADGVRMRANAASHAFFGDIPPDQWNDCIYLTPDTRVAIPREQLPRMQALRGEHPPSIEVLLQMPDGRTVPVLAHAAPIVVGEKLVAVVSALQDISALKEADRAKDEFLGILSHELLTPLSDTLGWTQAAGESPDMIPQALEIIGHNVRLLQRILVDLLDISRIIHGKLLLMHEELDLWDLVTECADEYDAAARERRRSLVLESPCDEMPVLVDQTRMRQVLNILLSNALKNTNAGDAIVVSAACKDHSVVLVIRDTGRGIEQEMLPHLFKPFQQGQPTEPGRGLGLALVKGIIELHGGEVTVDSPGVNQGTIFTIVLPLTR